MFKDTQFNLRLHSTELQLIRSAAACLNMDISSFILSVLIPYCLKLNPNTGCNHCINGICVVLSDSTVHQACIEGPCEYYEKSC